MILRIDYISQGLNRYHFLKGLGNESCHCLNMPYTK